MERVDFYLVINKIKFFLSDCEELSSQPKILDEIFKDFIDERRLPGYGFDQSQASRIFSGEISVGSDIRDFYQNEENLSKLAWRIEHRILAAMKYHHMVIYELRRHMCWDDELRKCLGDKFLSEYSFDEMKDEALYLARVIQFSISRPFIKRNKETGELVLPNWYAPKVNEYVRQIRVPKCCPYFRGRENELDSLHDMLSETQVVFVKGIAGIGKSELLYAYAEKYETEYNHILYVDYSGDLRNDIMQLGFSTDIFDDNSEVRITRHEYILRALHSDTLLIIDNFNATVADDPYVDALMDFGCKILISTRCYFEDMPTMELKEIGKIEELIKIVDQLCPREKRDYELVGQIIEALKHHTMAVVLAARLLKRGNVTEQELLWKLKSQRIKINVQDYFSFRHGKRSEKKTFYEHMRMLFALFKLSFTEADIMRNMVLTPSKGIDKFLFADVAGLDTMNTINDLIDLGLIQERNSFSIGLHPLVREMSDAEFKPTTETCRTMVENTHILCRTEENREWHFELFEMVEEMVDWAEKDCIGPYLRMLEDVFQCMERYRYYSGMQKIADELVKLLDDDTVGCEADRALLLDCKAALETNVNRQIELEKKALGILPMNSERNINLAANINSNMAMYYYQRGENQLAKEHLLTGKKLLDICGQGNSYDALRQMKLRNIVFAESGEDDVGLNY